MIVAGVSSRARPQAASSDWTLDRANFDYASAKRAAESLCLQAAREGLPVVVHRDLEDPGERQGSLSHVRLHDREHGVRPHLFDLNILEEFGDVHLVVSTHAPVRGATCEPKGILPSFVFFNPRARGGRERKGSVSIDGRKLSFRKLNRADPGAKNT